jgi:hypothetical protein
MNEEDVRKMLDDTGSYDEAREGSLLQMAGDFYGRQMRSTAVLVWANALIAATIAGAAAVLFFQTDQVKDEIMYATVFLAGVVWVAIIKVFAWLAINRHSLSREIKRLEIRVVEASEARGQHRES